MRRQPTAGPGDPWVVCDDCRVLRLDRVDVGNQPLLDVLGPDVGGKQQLLRAGFEGGKVRRLQVRSFRCHACELSATDDDRQAVGVVTDVAKETAVKLERWRRVVGAQELVARGLNVKSSARARTAHRLDLVLHRRADPVNQVAHVIAGLPMPQGLGGLVANLGRRTEDGQSGDVTGQDRRLDPAEDLQPDNSVGLAASPEDAGMTDAAARGSFNLASRARFFRPQLLPEPGPPSAEQGLPVPIGLLLRRGVDSVGFACSRLTQRPSCLT